MRSSASKPSDDLHGTASASQAARAFGNCDRSSLTDEIGTPDPQLEPQITSLEKCKIT